MSETPLGTELVHPEVQAETADPLEAHDPGGRPKGSTEYRQSYCHIGHEMYQQGATDFELAQELGVHPRTIYRWKAEHPEFRQALKLGRQTSDERVEHALFHRAVGYTHHSVKILQHNGSPVVVPYIEHLPPDVSAASFWLTNRKSKDWKQTKTVEVKHDNTEIEAIDAILKRFERLKRGEVIEGEVVPAAGGPAGAALSHESAEPPTAGAAPDTGDDHP